MVKLFEETYLHSVILIWLRFFCFFKKSTNSYYNFYFFYRHYLERKLTFEDETKIVGGNVVTDISQRPFKVSYELYFPGYFSVPVCGGAIIDDYTVLTAAHCCLDLINDDVIVRTGALKKFHQLMKMGRYVRYTFSSNHNIHKSSFGLYFWVQDSLMDTF